MTASFPLCVAGLVLAAACAAQAADAPTSVPADIAPSAQMAVRDAITGRLRAPTAAEAQALHAAGPQALRSARASQNVTHTHRNGAVGVRLSDGFMNYSVVVRLPGGGFTEYCFENRDAAEAAMAGGLPAPVHNDLPTE